MSPEAELRVIEAREEGGLAAEGRVLRRRLLRGPPLGGVHFYTLYFDLHLDI